MGAGSQQHLSSSTARRSRAGSASPTPTCPTFSRTSARSRTRTSALSEARAATLAAGDLVVQAPEIGTPELKELAKLAGAGSIVALPSGETQAFRLTGAGNPDEVARYCARAGLDFGFVPHEQRLDRVRLVAMDMDSTLISIECVDEIADLPGIKPEIAAITASAMRREIDFRESLTRR